MTAHGDPQELVAVSRRTDRVRANAATYTMRPCHDGYSSLYWAVTGGTADGLSGGVIMAWCYDEADALDAMAALTATGDYRNLRVENLTP